MRLPTRLSLVTELRNRDGNVCQYPGCEKEFNDTTNPPTIDHWMPQSWCYENGWTAEEVWDIDNLKLMCKSCNAKKGNTIPNEDGTLPARPVRERTDKSLRRPPCGLCEDGRLLWEGEICDLCGAEPGPNNFPKYLQKEPKECDHSTYHCWLCVTGLAERVPAWQRIVGG